MNRHIHTLLLILPLLLFSCNEKVDAPAMRFSSFIYPDYTDVTIPVNIAPLNFSYVEDGLKDNITEFSAAGISFRFKGNRVQFRASDWKKLVTAASGSDIKVSSSALGKTWTIHVSKDSIDYGINYRLIEPGYSLYSKMGIYERSLSDFKEHPLIENTNFSGCVNCHSYNRGNPDAMSLHIRGAHGATLLTHGGQMAAYDTKKEGSIGFCVYPYWHPSGNWIAYSSNKTVQNFHLSGQQPIEVFDNASDIQLYNVSTNTLSKPEALSGDSLLETFPAFSADGRSLYFCSAVPVEKLAELTELHYNLCRIDFDPETGQIGDSIETVIDAVSMGKSVSFPRPSYDGRFLVFTLMDFGTFSIWHHEADLWILDLASGEMRPMTELNSNDTESYHGFSSNSRWLVFSSRRDDGQFTRPYFAHISADGTIGKPFMLPQRDPMKFYSERFLSYNVPEFVTGPVELNSVKARKLINSTERIPFK